MTFTPSWGTGFEPGSITIFPTADRDANGYASLTTTAAYVKTGTYGLKLEGNYISSVLHAWVRKSATGAYVDVGVWVKPTNATADATYYKPMVRVATTDGYYIDIRQSSARTAWNAYVDGALVSSGSVAVIESTWQHIQARFHIDNSGYIKTKIDGVTDIDYSGDTKPGTGTVGYVYLWQYGKNSASLDDCASYWDDFVIGTGDWPGDIRFDRLVPTSDSSVQWTPSTGVSNYALVDEIPPSDSDYVSAGSAALKDLYGMGDWSGTAKTPQFLVQWARALKMTAASDKLKHVLSSGGTESASSAFDISTSAAYYSRVLTTDPSTGSVWTDSAIDAILAGVESA